MYKKMTEKKGKVKRIIVSSVTKGDLLNLFFPAISLVKNRQKGQCTYFDCFNLINKVP